MRDHGQGIARRSRHLRDVSSRGVCTPLAALINIRSNLIDSILLFYLFLDARVYIYVVLSYLRSVHKRRSNVHIRAQPLGSPGPPADFAGANLRFAISPTAQWPYQYRVHEALSMTPKWLTPTMTASSVEESLVKVRV
jgi:hypothetical protein